MEKHINLIRHVAWSFHKTTGIKWQDLFSEACLAYCECLRSYNPAKGAQTTWAVHAMRNALINFCKKEKRNLILEGIDDWYVVTFTPVYEFFEESKNLSADTQAIIRMVRENPIRYSGAPRKVRGKIKTDLREVQQWKWTRIWDAMSNLKEELAHDRLQRTVWM
jgi:RNA polymerase sigma factor (sigma-70 family)